MKSTVVIALHMIWAASGLGATPNMGDLTCPCRVTSFDIYLDGGTLGGRIEDSSGATLDFCLDGRMRMDTDPPGEDPHRAEPRLFYVGADHPDKPGAITLDFDGAEERTLLSILRSWVDAVMPSSSFGDAINDYRACKTRHERDQVIQANGFSEEQARALWVGTVVQNRQELVGAVDKD